MLAQARPPDAEHGAEVGHGRRLVPALGSAYTDLPGTYPTELNGYNGVMFGPVGTSRLRGVLQSGAASVGSPEVKADA
ncbi:hypothetical protein [Nonomuraea gerenzanensis]|uniref:Uncharacterized protein n=1 Tax=Nonomuraea gerenzanensis TaxID=93944 RepID=A0A1M4EC10_9ACTN|nr:hypothetical protein [Nonomuraea gerenzanensis]UBU18581.1 hypothetical protein LCN96_27230 [Nonomuraea gerenzanensis]SBO96425.1 hypothetical protein BN4615_P5941 [Nonomuraea gerenzanensis]